MDSYEVLAIKTGGTSTEHVIHMLPLQLISHIAAWSKIALHIRFWTFWNFRCFSEDDLHTQFGSGIRQRCHITIEYPLHCHVKWSLMRYLHQNWWRKHWACRFYVTQCNWPQFLQPAASRDSEGTWKPYSRDQICCRNLAIDYLTKPRWFSMQGLMGLPCH